MSEHIQYAVFIGPDEPLEAAREFHERVLPAMREVIADYLPSLKSIGFIFPLADYTHRGWRLAAVQALARDLNPVRVNAVEGDTNLAHDEIQKALEYLQDAPGITGQLLEVEPG